MLLRASPTDLEWQRVLEVIWLHPSFIIEFTCSTKHLLIAPRPENLPRGPTPGEHSLAQNHCAHGTKHGDCSVALTRGFWFTFLNGIVKKLGSILSAAPHTLPGMPHCGPLEYWTGHIPGHFLSCVSGLPDRGT